MGAARGSTSSRLADLVREHGVIELEDLPAVGLAFVIGGAIGNVIDRVREGAVLDFLLFHWKELAWPAFNLADSAIFVGVALLIYDGVFGARTRTA